MDVSTHKVLERLENEYQQYASSEKWTKDCVEMMKDLQKLMYYIEVRDAMKYGSNDYDDNERSYRRGPNMHSYNSYGNYGYHGSTSGRRYYDSDAEQTKRRLQSIYDSESNPEVRDALMRVMHEL